jgi:hypothetical protein
VHLHRLSNTAEQTTKDNDFLNDVTMTMILLANYRKNESTTFKVQLSIFANESALNAFGGIINNKLVE